MNHRSDHGLSLVEILVAMVVFAILLTMTAVIVTSVTQQAGVNLDATRAEESATVAIEPVAEMIQNIVSPETAWVALGNPSDQDPPASSGICWDDSANTSVTNAANGVPGVPDPGPQPPSPLLGPDPAGNIPAPSPYNGYLVDPSTLSVIYAHDTALEACAYSPNQSTPVVMEAWLDPQSCTSTAPSNNSYDAAAIGNCTIYLVEYNPYVGPTSSSTNDYAPADPLVAPNAHILDTIHHVWCDQACQAGTSCWSYISPVTGQAQSPPAYCPNLSLSTESQFTPPLFAYLAGQNLNSFANDPSIPLDMFCSPVTGSPPACSPSVNGASSTDDTYYLVTSNLQDVEISFTLLGNAFENAPGGFHLKGEAALTVQREIGMLNLQYGES